MITGAQFTSSQRVLHTHTLLWERRVTERNQTVGKELRVLIVMKLTGNITASMCTNYYVGCMNHVSYTRWPVYIVIHYSTDREDRRCKTTSVLNGKHVGVVITITVLAPCNDRIQRAPMTVAIPQYTMLIALAHQQKKAIKVPPNGTANKGI